MAVPWLMLPPQEGDESGSKDGGYRYFDVEARRFHALDNVPEDLSGSCCIGSSHGWLIYLDQRAVPLLYNPSLLVQIQLPRIDSLLGILNIEKSEDGEYRIKYGYSKNPIRYTKNLRQSLVLKAIMSSDPCLSFNKFGAVVIYGYERKIAYSNCGDDSWTALDGKHQPYDDIICSQNKLYALGNNASIEIWDFDGLNISVKRAEMVLSYPEKSLKFLRDFRYLYDARFYLVETKGDIMLVVRFVGEMVNGDGEAVHEEHLLSEEHTHPLVCPYKTLLFHVYKLDFYKKKWVVVDSLGDRALFLGGNHSVSVSVSGGDAFSVECKRDSIYFTDDYWDQMHEDYLYGGHDMGFFSLEDQSVKSFYQCPSFKIQPPPCWINRSPWKVSVERSNIV